MENKFTKGQWTSFYNEKGDYTVSANLNKGDNERIVAIVVPDETYNESADSKEMEANAKLIAAAPDMLAALNNCVDELKARGFKDTGAVQIGLRAISKATK